MPRPVNAPADVAGTLSATLSGRILKWQLTTLNLSGNVVAAVIHLGARGHVGARVVQICGHRGRSASGTIVLTAAQANAILNRSAYLNVGTGLNPHGEIRGQLVVQ